MPATLPGPHTAYVPSWNKKKKRKRLSLPPCIVFKYFVSNCHQHLVHFLIFNGNPFKYSLPIFIRFLNRLLTLTGQKCCLRSLSCRFFFCSARNSLLEVEEIKTVIKITASICIEERERVSRYRKFLFPFMYVNRLLCSFSLSLLRIRDGQNRSREIIFQPVRINTVLVVFYFPTYLRIVDDVMHKYSISAYGPFQSLCARGC